MVKKGRIADSPPSTDVSGTKKKRWAVSYQLSYDPHIWISSIQFEVGLHILINSIQFEVGMHPCRRIHVAKSRASLVLISNNGSLSKGHMESWIPFWTPSSLHFLRKYENQATHSIKYYPCTKHSPCGMVRWRKHGFLVSSVHIESSQCGQSGSCLSPRGWSPNWSLLGSDKTRQETPPHLQRLSWNGLRNWSQSEFLLDYKRFQLI